jgi:hypothetical protein
MTTMTMKIRRSPRRTPHGGLQASRALGEVKISLRVSTTHGFRRNVCTVIDGGNLLPASG